MKEPVPFGKYLLLERINVGGMAEIYLARSRGVQGFQRLLAIKKILPTMAEDDEFIAMFIDEARIAAELSHTGIVQIFELGKFEDDYYIAMEFIHGKDLRFIQDRMARERRPFDPYIAAYVGFKICEALDYAHNKTDATGRPLEIIHRDISPQNVILSYDGEVKICDFGIAKAANRSQQTQAGVLKGKFGYMSPEQVRGLPLDGRSDIFTVGTLLYEVVTSQRLFLGQSDFSTLEKVRNADVIAPSTYNRDIPEDLEKIVLRALSKDIEERHQSAAELTDALQLFLINHGHVTSRDLSRYMKQTYQQELEAELRRLEKYRNMPDPTPTSAGASNASHGGQLERDVLEAADAKTLIFASTEEGVCPTPPLSPERQNAGSCADASGQNGAKSNPGNPAAASISVGSTAGDVELGYAETRIFTEAELSPQADLHGQPAAMPRPRTARGKRALGVRARGAKALAKALPDTRTLLWMSGLIVLLGYAIFTTVLLSLRDDPLSSPPVFELLTRPSSGVDIFIDDRRVSEATPFISHALPAGEHRLKLMRDGYLDLERTIRLEPGGRLVMELALQPATAKTTRAPPASGTVAGPGGKRAPAASKASSEQPPRPAPPGVQTAPVVIESVPSGATVVLDGKPMGKTPRTLTAKVGQRLRVVLRLRGYHPASEKVRVRAGAGNKVRRVLTKRSSRPGRRARPAYGYLLANTRPWAKVYVDGRYTGKETPIPPDDSLKLTAGKHRLTFETPEGKRYDFAVEVKANETLKVIKKLE